MGKNFYPPEALPLAAIARKKYLNDWLGLDSKRKTLLTEAVNEFLSLFKSLCRAFKIKHAVILSDDRSDANRDLLSALGDEVRTVVPDVKIKLLRASPLQEYRQRLTKTVKWVIFKKIDLFDSEPRISAQLNTEVKGTEWW